jgi:hypothetical protein
MTTEFTTVPYPHVRIIRQYDRPNLEVAWWNTIIPQDVKDHYDYEYIDKGKLIEEWAESEDGLTLYHNSLYLSVDPAEYNHWKNDPIVQNWFTVREEYCNSVGIIIHPSIVYLVDWDGVETLIDLP